MSKITKSARDEPCLVNLPGCKFSTETTVFAHLSGAGWGQKMPDLFGAYCCGHCHDMLDGRNNTNMDKEFMNRCHLEGMVKTQKKLLEKGLITIEG